MYKIAVIGNKESVLPFKAMGIDAYKVYSPEKARAIIDRLARSNYGIIYVTEELAELIPETIDRYDEKIIPAITLIPSNNGAKGIGMKKINKNVEKAVGTNIL